MHSIMESVEDEDSVRAYVNWIDYLAIGLYFLVVIAAGLWSSKISKKDTVDGYFLAGRRMHWIPVALSLFGSNVGSEHFIGLSGSGASSGIGISGFEFTAMYLILVLGWYFMPVYMASNISTMPEYLQKRYGGQRIRIYLSVLALILYIFTKISANLYSGAIFIKLLLDIDNIYLAVTILVLVSALFTIFGGLTAVIWTDFMQMILMIAGAIYLSINGLVKVGGYNELMETFRQAGLPTDPKYQAYKDGCNGSLVNNTCVSCSEITPYYRNLFRPIDDPELPWPGIIGMTISGMWYWCTDQVIVQRALSAKNLSHAKASCAFASLLKLLPMYILIVPGMIARVLWPNQIGCSNPEYCEKICGSKLGCTNLAYPYLVIKLMPRGATGLMLSVILAAMMSSLTSIFNSASTIFIIDIYKRFRSTASEIEQVIMGRFFVVFLVVVSVIWIPFIENSHNSQLFHYIQSVTAFLAPPPCAVYLLSLFWPRTTEPGAFWSLTIGLVIGLVRFVLEYAFEAPGCGSNEQDQSLTIVSKIHYLHFGILLFVISLLITVVISLLTEKIQDKHLYRLTYQSRHNEEVREDLDTEPKGSVGSAQSSGELHKWMLTICCSRKQLTNQQTVVDVNQSSPEEKAKENANAAKDDKRYSTIIDSAAFGVVIVCSFFWGFYS